MRRPLRWRRGFSQEAVPGNDASHRGTRPVRSPGFTESHFAKAGTSMDVEAVRLLASQLNAKADEIDSLANT